MRTNDQTTALLGKVARLHYEHGLTHHEVAELLGLSRVKVTRLLAEARRTGVVDITVHSDEHLFLDLETQLVERFGLLRAWVGPTFSDDRAAGSLGALGAQCLSALITPEVHAVTVGFSLSVAHALAQMPALQRQDVGFIPATGTPAGLASSGSGVQLTLGFADAIGGHSYHLPAPLLASTPSIADLLRGETAVRDVLNKAGQADLLIAGMGAMGADSRMLINGLGDDDLAALTADGAVGDLCARFFDEHGRAVPSHVDQRLIGLTLDELMAIPNRVVIASGAGKTSALRAALVGGLINTLVTDTNTAEALLHSDIAVVAVAVS